MSFIILLLKIIIAIALVGMILLLLDMIIDFFLEEGEQYV